jgi:hypothetical protein
VVKKNIKSCNFRGDKTQYGFLGLTAASIESKTYPVFIIRVVMETQSPKRRHTFTTLSGCQPEKIILKQKCDSKARGGGGG